MKGAYRCLTVLISIVRWIDGTITSSIIANLVCIIFRFTFNNLRNLECSARSSIDCSVKQDGRAQAENMDQVLGLMYPFSDLHPPGRV
jgi:hypothetical protein